MFILLAGKSRSTVQSVRKQLIADFIKKHPGAEVLTFDCEESEKESIKYQEESQPGLFVVPKVLVLKNTTVLSPVAKEALKDLWKEERATDEQLHILVEDHYTKSDTWCKYLTKQAVEVQVFDKVSPGDVERQVTQQIARLGRAGALNEASIRLVVARTGTLEHALNETLKVLAYQPQGTITQETLQKVLPVSVELNIFHALDALFGGKKESALEKMYSIVQNGEGDTFSLLGMCAWQIRRMLLVWSQKEQGVTQPALIASATKLPPFAVQKILRQEQQFTKGRLVRALALLTEIDQDIKLGKISQQTAIPHFVAKL